MIDQILGNIIEVHNVYTMVDFYQYIKGIEYLICVAFFVAFPMYFKYVNEENGEINK